MRRRRTARFASVVILAVVLPNAGSIAVELEGAVQHVATPSIVLDAGLDVSATPDPIVLEYERLGHEFEKLSDARDAVISADSFESTDLALSDDEWLTARLAAEAKAPNPNVLLPQFVAFAKKHAASPLAFDALFFVVRKSGFEEFRGDGRPSPILRQAFDRIWEDHKADLRLVHLFDLVAIPRRQSETFLKRAIREAPNQQVRAAATFHLARYYSYVAGCHKKSQRATDEGNTRPTNEDRFWRLVVVPNLEKHLPLDRKANSERMDALLNQVVAEFSEVSAADWGMRGPGSIYVQTIPYESPKNYGDLAARILYEMKHLSPGNPAPDIVGQDVDGKTFRLSDYRGKVVLLTFCADWCPGCVELAPVQRKLQETLRGQPFVILSVNCDDSEEILRSHIEAGEITWRCWRDGRSGPIRSAWQRGLPGVTLLDHNHVIQDSSLGPHNTAEEFEQAIVPLVQKAIEEK